MSYNINPQHTIFRTYPSRGMIRPVMIWLAAVFCTIMPAAASDADRPVGWAGCRAADDCTEYSLTGGNHGTMTVLRADSPDMTETLAKAIADYDMVVLDGSAGDFVLSTRVAMNGLHGKTIAGINGARLRTEFHVTDRIRSLLDSLGVKSMSGNAADGRGGTLPNGQYVAEECEYNIRLALIDLYQSDKETYRKAGILEMTDCTDIIVRNLELAGPGSLDVGGNDLITLTGCRHVWLDHCHLHDGLDGNMDIVSGSDLVTVSWCVFDYTDLSYNHPLSNLVRGDEGADEGKLNITWACCRWGNGCGARLPWAQFGTNHILNCYYNCPGSDCIQGSAGTRLLVEGCTFDRGVKRIYKDIGTGALTWRDNIHPGHTAPADKVGVQVGYTYDIMDASLVAAALTDPDTGAGPTLRLPVERGLTSTPGSIGLGTFHAGHPARAVLNVSYLGDVPAGEPCLISASGGITLSADGTDYYDTLAIDTSEGYISRDIDLQVLAFVAGAFSGSVTISCGNSRVEVPVSGEALPLGERVGAATVAWPFDKGETDPAAALSPASHPFALTSCAIGDGLYVKGTTRPNGAGAMTTLNPTATLPRHRVDSAYVRFTVCSAPGYVFIPRLLSFNASRVGTDMSALDVEADTGQGSPLLLMRDARPLRNSASGTGYSTYALDLRGLPATDRTDFYIYIYYLSDNKQVALGDITINGDLYRAATSIADTDTDPGEAVYYNLQGMPVRGQLPAGVYIRRDHRGRVSKTVVR